VLIFAIKTSWSRMRRKAAPVTRRRGATTSATDYHQVRIAAKHVRYLCDAAAPALGPKARKLSVQAARIQDVLGEHHDAVVAGALIAEVAVLPGAAKGSKAFVRGGADGIHGGLLRAVRHHLRPFGAGLLSPSATERPDQVGRGGPQPSRLIAPDLVAEIGDAVVQPASCVERGTTIAGG